MMHGGAPSALVAWAAECIPVNDPMRIARVTVELLRPVPVAPLTIETEVLRQGRKIQLSLVRLKADGVEVCRGQVLKIRTLAADPSAEHLPPLDAPPPEDCPPSGPRAGAQNAFGGAFDMRRVHGGFEEPGPGTWWFNQHRPLVTGEAISPAVRAMAVADFSNGISSVLSFDRWTFLNGDLTVNFARAPRGLWILSKAESWIAADGAGLAMTRLADRHGYFGTATQSLVVDRR